MDESILLWINQGWAHPVLDQFFAWVSARLSFSMPLIFIIGAVLIRHYKADGLGLWLVMVLLIGLGDQTGRLLKAETAQARPCFAIAEQVRLPGREAGAACGSSLTGMPSNHALNFFVMASFLLWVFQLNRWTLALVLISCLVALSRIYLAKHYPSQVMIGMAIGTAYGFLGAWLVCRIFSFAYRIQSRKTLSDNAR